MTDSKRDKNSSIQKKCLVIIAVAVVITGIMWASSVLIPLVFAMFFAALLNPLCNWLETKNVNRLFAAFISVLFAVLMVCTLLYFFTVQVANITEDFEDIDANLQEMITETEQFIDNTFGLQVDLDMGDIREIGASFVEGGGAAVLKGVIDIFTFVFMFVLVPIYTFLLLIYRFFLKDFLIRAFSNGDNKSASEVINRIQQVAQKYLIGRLKVIAILSVINSAALLLIGVDHAIFFAVFAALFDFVYFIGPMIGAILPIVYALIMEDGLWMPITIALTFYVIQLFEGYVLTPKIVGPAVSINPLVTLVALFVGNLIWGIAGMILILPALAILKIIFDEVESLKPYSYLIGDTKDRDKPSWIRKKIQEWWN